MAQAWEHSAVNSALGSAPSAISFARPVAGRALLRRALLLLVGGGLVIDSVWLMSQGLFNFGIVLPCTVGLLWVFLALRWVGVQHWLDAGRWRRGVWRLAWTGFWLWLLSVLFFFRALSSMDEGVSEGAAQPAAIVVLGSGTPHGKPSPTLRARLDLAQQQAQIYPDAVVLVSGGKDAADMQSEGQIMGDYLRQQGLPPQRILQEEASTSTHENIHFSKQVLQRHGLATDMPVLLITSDFHTLRARWIAQRAGFVGPLTAGAPTPLYVRYNAWLREYFAFISGWLLGEY